jgi:ribonuclease HI
VGSASGQGADYFETLALLSGLSAIHRIDRTTRPIAIVTDSKCALRLLTCAADRQPLPAGRMFEPVRSLYGCAEALAGQRAYSLRLIGSSSTPEHKVCHRLSVTNLRAQIAPDPALSRLAALGQAEQRLQAIQRTLLPLQTEAMVLEAKIEAPRACGFGFAK